MAAAGDGERRGCPLSLDSPAGKEKLKTQWEKRRNLGENHRRRDPLPGRTGYRPGARVTQQTGQDRRTTSQPVHGQQTAKIAEQPVHVGA